MENDCDRNHWMVSCRQQGQSTNLMTAQQVAVSSVVVAGTSKRVDLCHASVEDQAALVQLEEVYFPVACQTVGDLGGD